MALWETNRGCPFSCTFCDWGMATGSKVVEFPSEKLDLEILEKKNTKELLGYLNKLHKCEESYELSDLDTNLDLLDNETIYFKNTHKWKNAYSNVKLILNKRYGQI